MFIECIKNNGVDYLRVMEAYRIKEGGGSKCRRRVVRNIGPLSRYDDGKPNYIARLRQSFKDGKPIIENLAELVEGKPVRRRIAIEYDLNNSENCFCDPKNIGYFLLDAFCDKLGIYDVLNKQQMQGAALLFIGEDLDVLLGLADRIMVLCGGQVSGIVDAQQATKEQIGLLMTEVPPQAEATAQQEVNVQ
jgi:hypothetical protein